MAAPPGFDPTASVLPDPGASSAPIHVMRGGGMKGGDRESILRAYRLAPGQELSSKFSEKEKEAFVEALNSGGCNWSAKSVLDSKCAPVVNVLKALLKQRIKTVNTVDIPEEIKVNSKSTGSWLNTLTKGLKSAPAAPAVVEVDVNEAENNGVDIEMSTPLTGLNAIAARARAKKAARPTPLSFETDSLTINAEPLAGLNSNLFENEPENEVVKNIGLEARTEVKNSPTNFDGNRSRRRSNLKLNLTRKNNRKLYSNFNINSNPIRIYGNTPSNIAKRYTFEVTRSQKLKSGIRKAEVAQTLATQNLNYQTTKLARAETERAISELRKANAETQKRRVAENAARAAEARRIKKEQEQKLAASQKRAANARAAAVTAEKEQEELEIASGIRKPTNPGFFTRAKGLLSFGKKGASRKNRRTRRKNNRK